MKSAAVYLGILACCLFTAGFAAESAPEPQTKVYFIAKTNLPFWTIYLRNTATGETDSFRARYVSGDSYIAWKLEPGTYRIIKYRRYDSVDLFPNTTVQFTVFPGCTNYYGRLYLYEDGSVMPGKAAITDAGVLNTDELKGLGSYIKTLFLGNAMCVSGEHDDFRVEWNSFKKYVEK